MRFDFTLISTFLFASAVLADHSREHRSSQFLDVVEKRTSVTSDPVKVVVSEFAGAILNATTPTFHTITGSISVPVIWGQNGSGVSILVGLDGGPDTHCGAVFAAGVICTIDIDTPVYTGKAVLNHVSTICLTCLLCLRIAAVYWLPGPLIEFTNFEVSYGDLVNVTVSVSDQNTGYATIQNLSKKIALTQPFSAQSPLCQRSAGWIVGKMANRDRAHFGFVPFSQPMAYGQGQEEFTAGGSLVYDMTTDDGTSTSDRCPSLRESDPSHRAVCVGT
ncbi:hypothetical protein JVT61DRAFT_4995 [Boletus reticuloceps]|uniref:Uncharacterized protein n=1 Tax=Boletus reticuloceps TaxID=495285 RepID=A0A8I2YWK5_9AGAM|nr:hypothetical protein JVT61DRAFT_4995 [Boletus reticuloceps]